MSYLGFNSRKANFYQAEVDECEPEIASYSPGALVFFSEAQAFIYDGKSCSYHLVIPLGPMKSL